MSFDESEELAGVEVSAQQVERAAEALEAEIAFDEHEQVEKIGLGTQPANYSRKPLRFSTASMPRNISASRARHVMMNSTRADSNSWCPRYTVTR